MMETNFTFRVALHEPPLPEYNKRRAALKAAVSGPEQHTSPPMGDVVARGGTNKIYIVNLGYRETGIINEGRNLLLDGIGRRGCRRELLFPYEINHGRCRRRRRPLPPTDGIVCERLSREGRSIVWAGSVGYPIGVTLISAEYEWVYKFKSNKEI